MVEMIIKRFEDLTLDELYDDLYLRVDVFVVEQNCPYPEIDGKDRYAYHLLCKDEAGKIIASLRILDKGQTFSEMAVGRVVVSPDHRGEGLGKKMMKRAIDFICKELKVPCFNLQAQAHLTPFYEKLGLKICTDIYLEDDIPHQSMIYEAKDHQNE